MQSRSIYNSKNHFLFSAVFVFFAWNSAFSLPWDDKDINASQAQSKGITDNSLVRAIPPAPGHSDKNNTHGEDDSTGTIDIMPSNMPSLEGQVKRWHILKKNIHNRKVCYIVNYASSKVGTHTSERKSYIMISYVSPQRREVSIVTGYNYRGSSIANVSIDGEQFIFFADKSHARPRAPEDNFKVISKMLDSSRMLIKSESNIGTYSVDTYLIDGFRDAYIGMIRLCQ